MKFTPLFTLCLALAFFSRSFGQTLAVTNSVGTNYVVTGSVDGTFSPLIGPSSPSWLSSSGSLSWTPAPNQRGIILFIEFGDGTFTCANTETHPFNRPNSKYSILMKATGIYDPDPRPHRFVVNASPGPTPVYAGTTATDPPRTTYANSPMATPLINNLAKIKVQPNIGSVVPDDPMVFVLTYRLDSSDKQRKIFFNYNNDAFFVPLNGTEEINEAGGRVPFVRFFQNETFNYNGHGNGYNDQIIIENLLNDGVEHNIFITLQPDPELQMQDRSQTKTVAGNEVLKEDKLTANIEADLADANGTVLESSNNALEVFPLSHDPNYIRIFPKCLSFPKTAIKELMFHAHCQNIGRGPAVTVKMTISLPPGLTSTNIYDEKLKLPDNVTATWDLSVPGSVVVNFTRVMTQTITMQSLDGMQNAPMWQNDPRTMGDVWFKIKTNPSVSNVLQTQASVVFSNAGGAPDNAPVLTNIDQVAFSACCNCKKKGDDTDCNKKKCRFWRWLFCKKY